MTRSSDSHSRNRGCWPPNTIGRMDQALRRGGMPGEVRAVADQIRRELNPTPRASSPTTCRRSADGPVAGVQHKYAQTCLVFPSAGQTCHAYCTFCFRWAQFVGMPGLKFATDEAMRFREYLRRHHEVTDVLFTGGDPMVMRTEVLPGTSSRCWTPEFDHIQTIRIGTKSLSYWPYRYLTDPDADDLLRLCERVTAAGRHLAIMAHFNHWRELEPPAARLAISRLRSAGAVIRTQSPLVRHINDDGAVWGRLWKDQVRLGCIPYYMFIERDTGPKGYFQVPLSRASRSTVRPSPTGRASHGPRGDRRCRHCPARWSSTAWRRWPGSRCSSSRSSRPATRAGASSRSSPGSIPRPTGSTTCGRRSARTSSSTSRAFGRCSRPARGPTNS